MSKQAVCAQPYACAVLLPCLLSLHNCCNGKWSICCALDVVNAVTSVVVPVIHLAPLLLEHCSVAEFCCVPSVLVAAEGVVLQLLESSSDSQAAR